MILVRKLRHCLHSDSANPKPESRRRVTLIIFDMKVSFKQRPFPILVSKCYLLSKMLTGSGVKCFTLGHPGRSTPQVSAYEMHEMEEYKRTRRELQMTRNILSNEMIDRFSAYEKEVILFGSLQIWASVGGFLVQTPPEVNSSLKMHNKCQKSMESLPKSPSPQKCVG